MSLYILFNVRCLEIRTLIFSHRRNLPRFKLIICILNILDGDHTLFCCTWEVLPLRGLFSVSHNQKTLLIWISKFLDLIYRQFLKTIWRRWCWPLNWLSRVILSPLLFSDHMLRLCLPLRILITDPAFCVWKILYF